MFWCFVAPPIVTVGLLIALARWMNSFPAPDFERGPAVFTPVDWEKTAEKRSEIEVELNP